MDKKNHNELKIKKKIKEYKKRLNNLKLQGFTFSSDILKELETLEKKIMQPTLFNQIYNKKVPLTLGVAGVFIIFSLLLLFPSQSMQLTVNNLPNGTIMNQSIIITGTAEQPNGKISVVQIKIDDDVWKEANGTNQWEYTLSIDTLQNGNHTLKIRCFNGEKYKTIQRTFFVDKETSEKTEIPSVEITYPSQKDVISGKVTIEGTASAKNQEIQRVDIRFDGNEWITVNGTTNWKYEWNTTDLVTDGPEGYLIEVKCITNESESEIENVLVIVEKNKDRETDLPPFDEGQFFQWYFPPGVIPEPNQEHELKMYIRQRTIENDRRSKHPYTIEIDSIQNKKDYITVSFPEDTIETIPDNKTYSYSYIVSLSDEAPKDELIVFTVSYTYYSSKSPFGLGKISGTEDVYVIPGLW
jgi:hypothetical protein